MWLLLDESDEQQDARLAAHIINVHQGRVGAAATAAAGSRQQAGASSSNSSRVSQPVAASSALSAGHRCFALFHSSALQGQVSAQL